MKIFITVLFTLCFAVSIFCQKQAEVIVFSTHLRSEPTMKSEKVTTLMKGETVVLEKSRDTNGWYYISTLNGEVKGWIREDTISEPKKAEIIKTESKKPQTTKIPSKPVAEVPTPPKNQTEISVPIPTKEKTPVKSTVSDKKSNPDNPAKMTEPLGEPPPLELPVVEDREVLVIETTEVSLNVRVVNAENRPVSNLKQAQFKIYEDDVLQPITSMTTEEVPVINALVIDNSRSLRSQLSKIIEAGKIIVGTNRPNDQSAVVRFVSSDKIEVLQDFTSAKNMLENALDNLFVEGGQTAIIDAVYETAKKVEQYQNSDKKEDVKLRSLIVVSDGDDRGSKYNEEQLFKLLRDSNVQIYAVGFPDQLSETPETNEISRREKARSFLTRLAEETGGKVFFPATIDELPEIAKDISGELRTQYLISYAPTNNDKTASFRKIKVVVEDGENQEKRNAITRTGRNVQPK